MIAQNCRSRKDSSRKFADHHHMIIFQEATTSMCIFSQTTRFRKKASKLSTVRSAVEILPVLSNTRFIMKNQSPTRSGRYILMRRSERRIIRLMLIALGFSKHQGNILILTKQFYTPRREDLPGIPTKVRLTYQMFEIEKEPTCKYDYLEINSVSLVRRALIVNIF